MKNEGVGVGVGETRAKGNSDFESTLVATTTYSVQKFPNWLAQVSRSPLSLALQCVPDPGCQ